MGLLGKCGWLSPEDGHTCAALCMTWIKSEHDARRLLFNKDAAIPDQSSIRINQVEGIRYKVETYLTRASSGSRVLDGYELIYTFPANDPEQMVGVFVHASNFEDLNSLEPIVEHMVGSLKWDPKSEVLKPGIL